MHARPGFSLLEAVVALAIVGVTAVAGLGAAAAEARAAEDARTVLEAEALAVQQLALIETLTGEELQRLPDSLARGDFEEPFARYHFRATTTPVLGEEGLTRVDVEVEWNGGSFPIRTMLYRRPTTLATGTP